MNLNLLPPVNGKRTINKIGALNPDIISVIHNNFPIAVKQTDLFSRDFKGKNNLESAFKIWSFLRNSIKYKKDSDQNQDIRLPNRLVSDGYGDCKSFSLFAASILANIGMPVNFRYVSYSRSPIPTHVYVTSKDERGNEIIIDGVYNLFNKESKFTFKKDHVMNVATLSGIGAFNKPGKLDRLGWLNWKLKKFKPGGIMYILISEEIARLQGQTVPFTGFSAQQISQLKASFIYLSRHPLRHPVLLQLIRRKLSQIAGGGTANLQLVSPRVSGIGKRKKGKFALKLLHIANLTALAPARHALLALIATNFRGLAGKFAWGLKRQREKLLTRWYIMGGKKSTLEKYINKGKRKKPLLGGKKTDASLRGVINGDAELMAGVSGIEGIGAAPLAALLVAAGTLLTALAPLFKGHKSEAGESMELKNIAPDGGSTVDAQNQILNPSNQYTATATEPGQESRDTTNNIPDVEGGETGKTTFKPSPLLLVGAGIAAYLIFSKKSK